MLDQEGRRFSPAFSTGRTGRIHRYYVLANIQLGREGERRDGAIRRVSADALESRVDELWRISERSGLGADDIPTLLQRLKLRSADTQHVLDRAALTGDDYP